MPTHEALTDGILNIARCGVDKVLRGLSLEHPSRALGQDSSPWYSQSTAPLWQWDATDLLKSLSDVGGAFVNHGRCKCTCTYKQRKLDGKPDCAQSITSRMNVRARPKVLISAHYKPSLSRSRILDSARIQAVTQPVLIMDSRIWFTLQQNNSSSSNLFLRAVQTSNLRSNRGSQNNSTDKRRRNTACRTKKIRRTWSDCFAISHIRRFDV